MQDHVEGYLELSGKTKTYFATSVSLWDANFYVKVDDDVHVNIGKFESWFTDFFILKFEAFKIEFCYVVCGVPGGTLRFL
jgi:hypothetical protein